jgi:leucine dehydrogenase
MFKMAKSKMEIINKPISTSKSTFNKVQVIDLLDFAEQLGCKELHMVTDQESGLKGIVAIYSVKLGPALGGCRFLPYATTNLAAIDAIKLAKAMAFKSAIAGLPLGGGKAVLMCSKKFINLDNRIKALKAFGRFLNNLNGRYITAVDSGTSIEDMDQIATETTFVTSTSKFSYSILDPSVLTARGVLRGILAAVKFKFAKDDLQNIHVAVQGVGHVGYHLVKLLYSMQAKISICDIDPKLINRCKAEFTGINIINTEDIYKVNADVFAPCALGGVLNEKNIEQLKVKIVAGAANNQLENDNNAEYLFQRGIVYSPDFVINAGGVIHVAGPVMKQTEQQTLEKVDNIYNILLNIFEMSSKQNINTYQIAYNIASDKLQ